MSVFLEQHLQCRKISSALHLRVSMVRSTTSDTSPGRLSNKIKTPDKNCSMFTNCHRALQYSGGKCFLLWIFILISFASDFRLFCLVGSSLLRTFDGRPILLLRKLMMLRHCQCDESSDTAPLSL